MKEIVASLLTLTTVAGTGYLAYKSDLQPSKFLSSEQDSATDYASTVFPYLQAAFSPLDASQGRLADDSLNRLKQLVTADGNRVDAREAARLIELIYPILQERERFRQRLNNGNNEANASYFNEQIAREWLARSNFLAPPLQRAYAELIALQQQQSGTTNRHTPTGYMPYFEMGEGRIAQWTPSPSPLDDPARPASGSVNGSATYTNYYLVPTRLEPTGHERWRNSPFAHDVYFEHHRPSGPSTVPLGHVPPPIVHSPPVIPHVPPPIVHAPPPAPRPRLPVVTTVANNTTH